MSKEPLEYTVDDFRRDVGFLKDPEIALLADYFPSYWQKNWRMTLLEGIKEGWDNYTILCNKIRDKKVDVDSDQSEGGHTRMIPFKIRRAAIRLWYIRYRKQGYNRRPANKIVREKHFPDIDGGTIAKNTVGCLLDKNLKGH